MKRKRKKDPFVDRRIGEDRRVGYDFARAVDAGRSTLVGQAQTQTVFDQKIEGIGEGISR